MAANLGPPIRLAQAAMNRRKAPKPRRPLSAHGEHEAIALRIHQIAAVAGAIAGSQDEPLSHALYLIKESLLEVEGRVCRFSGLGATAE